MIGPQGTVAGSLDETHSVFKHAHCLDIHRALSCMHAGRQALGSCCYNIAAAYDIVEVNCYVFDKWANRINKI